MAPINSFILRSIQLAYSASLRSTWKHFQTTSNNLAAQQNTKLQQFLTANESTDYGQRHHYSAIDSIENFQDRVPIVTYPDLEEHITRMAAGESNVLCSESVKVFERSSGSTTGDKLIPYTQTLLDEFTAATNPWLYNLYTGGTGMLGTQAYWSVSPAARHKTTTEGGIPIGFEDDTEYFGRLARWALEMMMAVPGTVARISDPQLWRRTTSLGLLAAERLGFISVWSPTFLTVLMNYIADNMETLLLELSSQRRDQIRRGLDKAGQVRGEAIWPHLKLLSCWTDASANTYIPQLCRWFPSTPIQSKGLLATEGVITIPLFARDETPYTNVGGASVLAAPSHFFEFIDENKPNQRPTLAHGLEPGSRYSPLLTTGNGFARYHLQDVVECVGHYNDLPLLRFLGKQDSTSDVCGEKLNATLVADVVKEVLDSAQVKPEFALLAPSDTSPAYYVLYLETRTVPVDLPTLSNSLENKLLEGYHYNYCRDLNQLGPARVIRVRNGWTVFEQTLLGEGQRAGNIKPTALDRRTIWGHAYRDFIERGDVP